MRRLRRSPITASAADEKCKQKRKQSCVSKNCLLIFVTVKNLDNTLAVHSLVKFFADHGQTYESGRWQLHISFNGHEDARQYVKITRR